MLQSSTLLLLPRLRNFQGSTSNSTSSRFSRSRPRPPFTELGPFDHWYLISLRWGNTENASIQNDSCTLHGILCTTRFSGAVRAGLSQCQVVDVPGDGSTSGVVTGGPWRFPWSESLWSVNQTHPLLANISYNLPTLKQQSRLCATCSCYPFFC